MSAVPILGRYSGWTAVGGHPRLSRVGGWPGTDEILSCHSCASAPSCGSLCLHADNVLSYAYSRTFGSHLFAPPVVSAGLGIYRTAVPKLEGREQGKTRCMM